MQCSVCHYEFTMREVQAAVPCPSCEQRKAAKESAAAAPVVEGLAPHVKKVVAEYKGAQPVVVMDIHMSFNSMVWFMVKWVIASIPAMIILGFLLIAVMAFFGGFAGFMSR